MSVRHAHVTTYKFGCETNDNDEQCFLYLISSPDGETILGYNVDTNVLLQGSNAAVDFTSTVPKGTWESNIIVGETKERLAGII